MIVYAIVPILAYMLTGCNEDQEPESNNRKVEENNNANNSYTVFYGTVIKGTDDGNNTISINFYNIYNELGLYDSAFATDVEFLFSGDTEYFVVTAKSNTNGNAVKTNPEKTFKIKDEQTMNQNGDTYLYVKNGNSTELTDGELIFFVEKIGNSTDSVSAIDWQVQPPSQS